MSDVIERITTYLINGGLFNPELADHRAVRDLLIDARAELAAERERAERVERVLIEARLYLSGDALRAANLANLLARIDALVIKGGGDE